MQEQDSPVFSKHFVDGVAAAAPALIVAYFVMQTALRLAAPGGLGLDEAQILLHAQSLDLGYGPQPPLYAWLQIAVFRLMGEGLAGIALLKNLVLAATPIGLWLAARAAGAEPPTALVATLCPFFAPGFAWEAQRALTHTPLAIALVALSLPVFIHLRRGGGLGAHLLFGLLCGAAIIAKWNAAFAVAGLFAALAMRPAGPRRRLGAALAIAAAVVAPPLLWTALNADAAMGDVRKFGLDDARGWAARLAGATAFGAATLAAFAPPAAALALLGAGRAPDPARAAGEPALRRDLALAALIALAVALAAVLVSGATEVKERWLAPLGPLLAVPAALWLQPRLTARRVGPFAALAGALALIAAVALQVNWRYGSGRPSYQTAPFESIAPEIVAGAGTVVAETDWIGGNLRNLAPGLAVITPGAPAPRLETPPPHRLVWRGDRSETPPDALRAFLARRFGREPEIGPARVPSAPYPPPHSDRAFALGAAEAR
jgi:4-amino-4-deoxy-L-arabinose transferase-like glycosyltransferase